MITAFVSGIEPGSYVESMASMTTAMVAVFSGLFAFVGWLQLRPAMAVIPPGASDLIGGAP